MVYFTADLHLNHDNILIYCERPFEDISTMNSNLINNWNSIVKPEDLVYHVGDFCFGDYRHYINLLNGKIIFIKGNHDRIKESYKSYRLNINGKSIHLQHKPIIPNNKAPEVDLILCGHVHNHWMIKHNPNYPVMINVGVDVWDFKPITFEQIEDLLYLQKDEY